MQIEGQFPVEAPPEALMQHLFDARLMASCLPGCEELEPIADDRYRAVVVIAMAGIKARFDLQVEITRKDERNVWATTRGEEGGNASTLQAQSQVTLQPDGEGTQVSYRSDVSVTGRLGRFALGMMKKKAQSLGDEFAQNLQAKLQGIGAQARVESAAADVRITEARNADHDDPAVHIAALAQPRSWWQALLRRLFGEREASRAGPSTREASTTEAEH